MIGLSSPAIIRYSLLPSGFPGTIAGPWAPPASAASRERRSSLDSWIALPWHFQQDDSKMGWISLTNEMVPSARNWADTTSDRVRTILRLGMPDVDYLLDCNRLAGPMGRAISAPAPSAPP